MNVIQNMNIIRRLSIPIYEILKLSVLAAVVVFTRQLTTAKREKSRPNVGRGVLTAKNITKLQEK